MRDDYPTPVSDPEADGLPETADDDSTANDEVESGRQADGPAPAPLPGDLPLAVDRFGTTAEEQRRGDSLDQRLAQEEPDILPEDPLDGPPAGRHAAEEPPAETDLRADPLDGADYDPRSPVSVYDRPGPDGTTGRPVGRLVEPDEGAHTDEEKDAIAYDAGAAGGGASAEELAMHETPAPD